MAIIIENGTVVAGAESYTAIADVDAYFTSIDGSIPAAWTSASTAVKEGILRKATRYLDAKYRELWIGNRYKSTQELEWPRTGATTRDGFLLAVTEIPKELKWATSELCSRIATSPIDPDLSSTRKVTSERLRAEPLEIQSSFSSVDESHTVYQRVDMLLGRILRTSKPGSLAIFTLERA